MTTSAEGSTTRTLDDGSAFSIDFDDLTDPDGRRYAIVGSVYQESESADVVYELQLVEDQPRALTQAQIDAAWLDTSPDASDADLAAFQAQRASAATMPAPGIEIDSLAQDWIDTAAAGETTTFVIKLADQPALDLPQLGPGLADTDPTFVLDQMEDRLIAIEARKTEVDALQADLVADLQALGAQTTGRYWTVNALQVEADADTIRAVSDSAMIARIELNAGDLNETANRGEKIRVASQIKQYLDNGFDGSTSSGRSAIDTIYVALVDEKVDIDHPAWGDCSLGCVSRLVRQEEWTGSAWIEDTVGNTGGDQHGMRVAGQLLADLTEGQDLSIRSSTERKARTGMSTETSFVAIDKSTGGIDRGLDRGVELNVDIMNLSSGCGNCTPCCC